MLISRFALASIMSAASLSVVGCATTEDGAETASADSEAMICRRVESVGSRFAERVCRTRGEWEAEAEANREFLERAGRAEVGSDPADSFGGGG